MKEKLKALVYDTAAIVVGNVLLAAGLVMFTVPCNIAPGGVSGLATALAYITPLSVGVWSLLLNVPLFLAAWRLMGWRPLIRTLAATVLLSVLIDVLPLPAYTGNVLLAAVLGGVLTGAGIGLLFLRGSSSGGTELLSMLLLRVFPNMPVGSLLMCIDAAVVALAVLVFRDLEVALYSMVTIFVCSKVIDGIMEGMNYAKVIYVVTDRGDAVTEALNTGTERGVTVLPAQGGYTRRHKDVLMTVTRQNAMAQTLRLIKQTDPRAFLFVVNATEVHGEGFQKYDAAIK